ncbi:MAG TPA: succinyl-diaminopimelate desuccinylase [Polyangiales bacterium]|nr:succinyl-diaminopimelate desuccinylase [Polyangiales bacterium]
MLANALAQTLLDLCLIPSPIGEEKALCDHVQARLQKRFPSAITRFQDSLIVHANAKPGAPKIALVGHLDVVRTQHDKPARIEGTRLFGAGAADMKSGLALMIELAERLDLATLPVDLTLVFYEREEGPFAENVLGPMIDTFPQLHAFDMAICLEPSDNRLQLGCMGSLHATITFEGRTAHSARPWEGVNAITKAASLLAEFAAREPNLVVVDGMEFREVMTPTLATGGRGRNVVPDKFELNLNYRFAPGKTPSEALAELEAMVAGRAKVVATDLSPAGRPHAAHPLVQKLVRSGVKTVERKQAWTDVARFDQIGVPAVNFGPGLNAQAHQHNEYTDLPLLAEGYEILRRFLTEE